MVDLWNPVQRARVCLSCHVGDPDPDQHKTITHAMFQAGHPPLGTIELAAACDEQPRHWQLMRCKAQPAQQRQGFKIGRMEQAELVAAGALLTLQRSAEMLASQLESSGPDFARYDCTACHHELPRPLPSLTLAEQDNAFAGRPLEPRWSRALVDVGLIAAADDKSAESTQPLRDQLGALHEALSHQPFGDRTRTIEAARNLARWLDRPLDALSEKARPAATKVVDLETERRMIRQLCATGSDSLCDFDTARQRAWALRSLWSEYSASSPKLPAGTKRRVDALLARLDEELQLSLGWRHLDLNDACALEDLANTQHPRSSTILGEPLRNRLGAAMRFNRESFAKTLAEIATELGDSK
jgi:hypothetical protein